VRSLLERLGLFIFVPCVLLGIAAGQWLVSNDNVGAGVGAAAGIVVGVYLWNYGEDG
jgi:hypothetical protein